LHRQINYKLPQQVHHILQVIRDEVAIPLGDFLRGVPHDFPDLIDGSALPKQVGYDVVVKGIENLLAMDS
jgi:hypothetical protein